MNLTAIIKVLKEVVKWGPLVAKAGSEIYDQTKEMFGNKASQTETSTTLTVQDLNKKIIQLEQNDLDQAKLLSEMAQQTDNFSKLTKSLAIRILYATIISSIALVIAVYLLIRSLI